MTTTAWNPPAPWRGLRRRPVSHPVRGTAWRAALLSLIGVPLGLLGLVALVAVLALGIALAPVGVGLGLLAVLPSFVGVLGRVERTLVRLVDPEPVAAAAGSTRTPAPACTASPNASPYSAARCASSARPAGARPSTW